MASLRKKLGDGVSEALELYLKNGGGWRVARTHVQIKSPTMRNLVTLTSRILRENHGTISHTQLERYITETIGGNHRTLKKYTDLLVGRRILIPTKFVNNKPVYEVKEENAEALIGLSEKKIQM